MCVPAQVNECTGAFAVSRGFSGTAAIAEPTLDLAAGESFRMSVPETTSYQAASSVHAGEQDGMFNWNP